MKLKDPAVIEVEVRQVYGKDLVYPVNAEAKILAQIARSKTLSLEVLAGATALGLNIKEVNPRKLNLNNS